MTRSARCALVGALAFATFGLSPSSGATEGSTSVAAGSAAFSTVGDSSWTVPAGVCQIEVTLAGGAGGAGGADGGTGGAGGLGAVVVGTLAVTAGQSLALTVGGAGGDSTSGWVPFASSGASGLAPAAVDGNAGVGGVGGGGAGGSGLGAGGGGGGGASSIAAAGTSLVVAGGGGGGGADGPAGVGGPGGAAGLAGTDGVEVVNGLLAPTDAPTAAPANGVTRATGGGAGTSTAGGAGGASVDVILNGMLDPAPEGDSGTVDEDGSGLSSAAAQPAQTMNGEVVEATDGGAGVGGDGASSGDGGGGGGGGLFGGGGGGAGFESSGAGGGGGASLVPTGGTLAATNAGDGQITIAWSAGGGCVPTTVLPSTSVASLSASPRFTG